jgi:exopolysaccharide production protein ExoZ
MFETPETTPRAGTAKRASEVHSIQLLRFIAALAVVVFHSQGAFGRNVDPTLGYWFELGAAGVHVFFCISGFVIMHTSFGTADRGMPVRRFLLRRFVRIFPIYWLCCILYVAYHQSWGEPYAMSADRWIGAFLLLPSGSARIIGPGWTLSFEVYFYLCFAAVLRLRALPALLCLSSFFVLSILVGIVLSSGGTPAIPANPLILEFIAGCWLGYLYDRWRVRSAPVGAALVLCGLLLFIAGGMIDYRTIPLSVIWGTPSILIVAGTLMIEQARGVHPLIRSASRLGDSSYVLYLIHVLCITIALDTVLRDDVPLIGRDSILATVLMSLICVVAAALIFDRIEKPMLRWLRRNVVDRWSSSGAARTAEFGQPVSDTRG